MPHRIVNSSQITVSERVKFSHQTRDYFGYVHKKGRKYAYIICDDNNEFKVPYHMLSKVPGAKKQRVQSQVEKLRLQFHVNNRVNFEFKGQVLSGVITRLNPKRAHIICDDEKEYQVPYAGLTLASPAGENSETGMKRSEKELNAIVQLAQTLMQRHRLNQWSFQFDNGMRRAGCCHFDKHVISLSYEFARHAPEEAIQDAILHEIAHVLVGKEHNHDAVWQAKAIEIGCSGNRCHDLQFTPPRYIVTCENHCWVGTAERRRRNVVCQHCHGKIMYMTYTEERWNKEQSRIALKASPKK
jgi:predicted SprT family Zn-dependent metalloprotease